MTTPKVIIPMADYGHDPTETSVPYTQLKRAGFDIQFATENGKAPECDQKLLKGVTQKLLGATSTVLDMYKEMTRSPEFLNPLSWTSPTFSLENYNLVLLPGGHDKGVRQLLDSTIIRSQLASYFPQTRKPSSKYVAAVCHGVLAVALAEDSEGKSVLKDCVTTTLPAGFESGIFWVTRAFLGDYYKTYGAGSDTCEQIVKKKLVDEKKQWKSTLTPGPFVVEDEKYNYISARYPGDAELFAERIIALVKLDMDSA